MRYAGQIAATALVALCWGMPGSWAQSDTDESGAYAQRLRELLRVQGYSQIDFVDLKGATITAKACSGDSAYRVTINRNGRILERDQAGACDPAATGDPVSPDVIIDALYGQGFLRINVLDRTPPTFLVNACRGGHKYQVRLDDDGDIIDSKDNGACNLEEGDAIEPAQIERILTLQGYRDVRMPKAETDDDTYVITACAGVRQFELTVTEAAQVAVRKATGFCEAGGQNVAYVPPRPVEDDRVTSAAQLEPETCQRIADWLQYEKPITFAEESANLGDGDLARIAELAQTLKRCSSAQVLVEGHTSKTGSDEMNQELSEKRALAVQKAFSDQGIPAERLVARGFGESYPRIVTEADANLNRRIEINLEWAASSS
jgi:outer membrane protein OmpA-like peptidoglycan-associated protein